MISRVSIAIPPEGGFEAPSESAGSGRIDGRLKVTGAMPYAADLVVEGTLYAGVVRSPHPHARIVRVDTAAASALPGVRCVLTGRDVASIRSGRALRDIPILAVDKARFAGEMVAAVAADSPEIAEQAAALIDVEYASLPAVFDVEQAVQPDAAAVHDDPAGYAGAVHKPGEPANVIGRVRWVFGEEVEAALATSQRVFDHTFRTPKVHQGYIEPHCCTVYFDRGGKVRVWSCNKAPYRLREYLGATFDLAPEDIEAYTAAIGGDFGGKGAPMDIPLCLELSRRTGRPVRMARGYPEELIAGDPRHGSVTRIRMGVTAEGAIQAVDVLALFNSGAYGGHRPSANFRASCGTSYRIGSARVEAVRVYTNEVPCGNARAPGAPQMTFAFEAMMDLVARGIGLDPFEFRRRNLLRDGETTIMGHVWPESRGVQTLDAAVAAAQPAFPAGAPPNMRFGRGMALYDRPTHEPQRTSMRLRLLPDGRIEAQVPIQETGTGSHTMVQGVVARALGIEREQIVMRVVGTTELPWDSGVGGSRVTVSCAESAVITSELFRAELGRQAAEALGVPAESVKLRPGGVCEAGDRSIDLAELGRRGVQAEATGEVDGAEGEGGDGATSFVAQIAQVGVDTDTGQVTLYDFTCAVDVAEVLDPQAHRGQIEGGIAQGLGYALSEDLGIVDGRVTAAHLGDYKMPTMPDMPRLQVALLPGGIGVGARNVKSIGEIGNVPAAAAVANAVADAIGAPVDTLPVTAERVLEALRHRA
jgi:putative selenate reductase molybdopterin-binding subunit